MGHEGRRRTASVADMRFSFYFIAGTSGVGRIMIGMKREEAEELAVAEAYRTNTLRDAKTVNPLVPGPAARKNGSSAAPDRDIAVPNPVGEFFLSTVATARDSHHELDSDSATSSTA